MLIIHASIPSHFDYFSVFSKKVDKEIGKEKKIHLNASHHFLIRYRTDLLKNVVNFHLPHNDSKKRSQQDVPYPGSKSVIKAEFLPKLNVVPCGSNCNQQIPDIVP